MTVYRGFASDNNAGAHPEVLKAMAEVNQGHTLAYGDDRFTREAIERFKHLLGEDIEVFFVYNGTGANVTGLQAITRPYEAVVCPATAHINCDECGAPEKIVGCKLLAIPTADGKLTVEHIKPLLGAVGVEHHSQPKVISITQSTEMGTVYKPEELRELTSFAHQNGMYVQMDGARIANAAAGLGVSLREITTDAGIDVLSFGGAKNGIIFGEAVVFFKPELAENFKYIRKQSMQLASKMRFIAAQFNALLSGDLWLKSAEKANRMARLLASEVEKIPQIQITQKVEANGVFAVIPREAIPFLQERYYFYVWNEQASEVRWITSFDTTEEDIKGFVQAIKEVVK